MYKASKRRFDEDAKFKDRARKAVTQLQGGNPQFVAAWQRICEASRKVRPCCAPSSMTGHFLCFVAEPACAHVPSVCPYPCSWQHKQACHYLFSRLLCGLALHSKYFCDSDTACCDHLSCSRQAACPTKLHTCQISTPSCSRLPCC